MSTLLAHARGTRLAAQPPTYRHSPYLQRPRLRATTWRRYLLLRCLVPRCVTVPRQLTRLPPVSYLTLPGALHLPPALLPADYYIPYLPTLCYTSLHRVTPVARLHTPRQRGGPACDMRATPPCAALRFLPSSFHDGLPWAHGGPRDAGRGCQRTQPTAEPTSHYHSRLRTCLRCPLEPTKPAFPHMPPPLPWPHTTRCLPPIPQMPRLLLTTGQKHVPHHLARHGM